MVLGLPGLLFEYGVIWLRGSSSYACPCLIKRGMIVSLIDIPVQCIGGLIFSIEFLF